MLQRNTLFPQTVVTRNGKAAYFSFNINDDSSVAIAFYDEGKKRFYSRIVAVKITDALSADQILTAFAKAEKNPIPEKVLPVYDVPKQPTVDSLQPTVKQPDTPDAPSEANGSPIPTAADVVKAVTVKK